MPLDVPLVPFGLDEAAFLPISQYISDFCHQGQSVFQLDGRQ